MIGFFSARTLHVALLCLASACATAPATSETAPPVSPAAASTVAIPDTDPRVRSALDNLRAADAWLIEQQISICQIEAPPFKERRRAEDFAARFRALGYANARLDSIGNVIVERPGEPGEPVLVLSAHLDTVFPEGTDVTVRQSGDTLRGPGIGDDCRGLAVLLAIGRSLNETNVRTRGTIIFVGTVGEEGAGNLRGVRHLVDVSLKDRIDHFVSIDDAGFTLVTAAVGSNRYRVTYRGPGGHSYTDFGMPNPNHALGRAIALLSEVRVPEHPKTTYSVGIVAGGTTVNAIPATASMDVDLRSESPTSLATLDSTFRRAVASALAAERARWPTSSTALNVKIDTIGIRPAGTQSDASELVRAAISTARELGVTVKPEASSTDANYPISRGIPAITIGYGGIARGTHSLAEIWIKTPDADMGPRWAMLIAFRLAGVR
ncbi:MAG: M20/M25/M40 family metallo-hydrolase [Gemmatimonadaceae bacterium]|nr:M20/M25/M40 family metallo-hydrolase [Gemmatimonadaceae bacterium]